jgi:hypothetical protein
MTFKLIIQKKREQGPFAFKYVITVMAVEFAFLVLINTNHRIIGIIEVAFRIVVSALCRIGYMPVEPVAVVNEIFCPVNIMQADDMDTIIHAISKIF